jgi:hypothetical protein
MAGVGGRISPDNMVEVVNTGYSKHPRVQHLIHCLFFIVATFDLTAHAVHIPGVQNGGTDAISRNNLTILSFASAGRPQYW